MSDPSAATKSRTRRRKPPQLPVPAVVSEDALLTVREVAAWRRGGVSTVWRDVKRGTLPQPVYVTPRSPRWRLRDLRRLLGAE